MRKWDAIYWYKLIRSHWNMRLLCSILYETPCILYGGQTAWILGNIKNELFDVPKVLQCHHIITVWFEYHLVKNLLGCHSAIQILLHETSSTSSARCKVKADWAEDISATDSEPMWHSIRDDWLSLVSQLVSNWTPTTCVTCSLYTYRWRIWTLHVSSETSTCSSTRTWWSSVQYHIVLYHKFVYNTQVD